MSPSHRSPLRYPGGKRRLTPFVREILAANGATGWSYCEPFAGGAGVGIDLLLNDDVDRIYLNDISRHVYAFWWSVVRKPEELCDLVARASLTLTEWHQQREVFRDPRRHSLLELGFSTFFLNRCNRSGILRAGVIGGQKQDGTYRLDARFPRNELIRRIELIASRSDRIRVSNVTAEEFIRERASSLPWRTLVYCDPPYVRQGDRLYPNSYTIQGHQKLARLIQTRLGRPWLVSYNQCAEVTAAYAERRKLDYSLQYSAVDSYVGTETFIFSDRLKVPSESSLEYVNRALVAADWAA